MAAMATKQALHMNGGEGETSYAKNSSFQKKVILSAKPILEESIMKIYCTASVPSCLKVADLGCSSGPNALVVAFNVITIVHETCRRLKVETPIFQFFLNDLFGNDFNTIFKSLPQFYDTLQQEKESKSEEGIPKCYINATPGSFYGRLFPSNSIHFFHSSYSLHWLSQSPKERNGEAKLGVDDQKGNAYYNNPEGSLEQFKQDFRVFLRSRSQELVPGGAMLLTIIGRFDSSETITAKGLIHMLLSDMVSQNLIEEAKLKCFSMPLCHPTEKEVREIIKEEGCFSVERLDSIKTSWDGSSLGLDEDGSECFEDEKERAKFIAKYMRAIFEPILKAHFGEGIMDELFLRFQNKIVQLMGKLVHPTLVLSLIKNA